MAHINCENGKLSIKAWMFTNNLHKDVAHLLALHQLLFMLLKFKNHRTKNKIKKKKKQEKREN